MNKDLKKIVPIVVLSGAFSLIPFLAVVLSGHFAWPGAGGAALGLVAGAMDIVVLLPYLRALSITAAPDVLLMWNLAPIIIAVLAHFVLHETLLPLEYVAIALLVASSFSAALHPREKTTSIVGWYG